MQAHTNIMDFLFTYSVINWLLILLSAFIIGLSKAGLKGIDMMNVTIMVSTWEYTKIEHTDP